MRGYGGLCGSAQRSDMSLFFFSSRRRHTRWPRDWSSDVCSSDLPGPKDREAQRRLGWGVGSDPDVPQHLAEFARSEERRVGKECRARWERGLREKRGDRSDGGLADGQRAIRIEAGAIKAAARGRL